MKEFPFLGVLGCFERWLRKAFYQLGLFVGSKPILFLLLPIILTLLLAAVTLSSVMTGQFKEEDRVWYMYSPSNAPSHKEHAVAADFFRDEGMKFLLEVGVMAKDGGDLLREGYLEEVVEIAKTIRYNTTVEYEGEVYRYEDVCDRHCNETEVLRTFAHFFRNDDLRQHPNLKLTYPTFKFGYDIGDYYVGSLFVKPTLEENQRLKSVKIMNLKFQSAFINAGRTEILRKFEKAVFDSLQPYNSNESNLVNITALSEGLISNEIRRNGIYCISFFVPSSILIFIFVLLSSLRKDPVRTKPWEGLGGVVCPMLSIVFAFGLLLTCGVPFMVITLVTPFLIMAIGVDDCFIILHAWHKSNPKASVPRRLAETMSEAGPSITITSLTNAVSFGVGALSPTPAIRVFCIFTSVGIAVDFVFQITFFAAVMTLGGRREEEGKNGYLLRHCDSLGSLCSWAKSRRGKIFPTKKNSKRPLSISRSMNFDRRLTTRFAVSWSRAIMHPVTKCVVYVVLFTYWGLAAFGFSRMKVDMKSEKAILDDSPIQSMLYIYDNHRLAQGDSYNVFVNNPPNFNNRSDLARFQNFVQELEGYRRAMGQESTILWYRSYIDYLSYIYPRNPLSTFYRDLPSFLYNYNSYQNFVKLKEDVPIQREKLRTNMPNIDRFVFTSAMGDMTAWSERTAAQIFWRETTAKYPEFNATVYYPYSFYIDQQLTLLWVTCLTVIIALIVMFAICILFIPNFASVICSTVALLSINAGVFGLLYFWDVKLDPISMSTLLMAIGFSVDFTCHISYHYYKAEGNDPSMKLTEALTSIGWPMTQAGLSTLIGVLTLFLSGSYMIITFAKTVILVVGLGLIHGLVVIPVVLTTFPYFTKLLPQSCAGRRSNRSHRSDEDTISSGSSALSSSRSPTLSAASTPPSSGRWKNRVVEASGKFPPVPEIDAVKRKDSGDDPAELTGYHHHSNHANGIGTFIASAGSIGIWHRPTQIQKLVLNQKLSLPATGQQQHKEENKRKLSRTKGIQEEIYPEIEIDHQTLASAKSL